MDSGLLAAFREAGAEVSCLSYPELNDLKKWMINRVVYGDDAWKAYKRWALTQSVGKSGKGPSIVCPESCKPGGVSDNHWQVLDEVRSILKHFSALTIEALEEGHTISGPTADFSALESVKHPKLAIAMAEIIQSPPPTYVAINALDSGSFICAIVHMWGHSTVTFEIYRK